MKALVTIIFATISTINFYGQTNYINVCVDCNNLMHSFDFNSSTDSTDYFLIVDTSQSNNLWQLGTPNKTVFNYGYWGPKAFVTDTLNPYPINNTSSFQFSMINCSWMTSGNCGGYMELWITIITKINSDSKKDGGTIEVSHNNSPWVNLINDSLAYITGDIYSSNDTIHSMGKPGYSGNSDNWNQIDINYQPEMAQPFDTITLRFTFTSDSIQTNKDGWMIGLIQMGGNFEGIEEIQNDNLISIYPIPASEEIVIQQKIKSEKSSIKIYDLTGRLILEKSNFTEHKIDVQHLNNGIYMLKYSDTKNFSIKKIVVQH